MAIHSAPSVELADKWEIQLRKGCLELAILAALWRGRLYGLEIMRRLSEDSGLNVPEGTVYPLLSRLKSGGLLSSEWVEAEAGHPRKYYRLTAVGRRRKNRPPTSHGKSAATFSTRRKPQARLQMRA